MTEANNKLEARPEARPDARPGAASALRRQGSDRYAMLRATAARSHQLRALTRAADRFLAQGSSDDSTTGAWLISCAETHTVELLADIGEIAQHLKDGTLEPALVKPVQRLRVLAHQLHACMRGADHYLEQEGGDSQETGSWLIATALGLADTLATELDDLASSLRRSSNDPVIDADHAAITRRAAAATRIT